MCFECGMDGPVCNYCGDECYGTCGDPDTCGYCWGLENGDDYEDGEDALDDCIETGCPCACHEGFFHALNRRYEAGVMLRGDDALPYERKGVFQFLAGIPSLWIDPKEAFLTLGQLPGEIRDKIYGYAMHQNGKQRAPGSRYHRGTIHTALLQTCRQVNSEAKHLPLTINRLCFSGPLSALHFVAFCLPSTMSGLVKAIHIEQHISGNHDPAWGLLIKELAKMDILHLGLTVTGGFGKSAIMDLPCFAARFTPLSKLKSFELQLGSAFVDEKDTDECLEYMKTKLIKGYVAAQNGTKNLKRIATDDIEQSKEGKKPAKMSKKNMPQTKNTKRSTRSSAAKDLAKQAAQMQLRASLMVKYSQLKEYATSLNLSLVRIRLEDARNAAEAPNQQKFESLAHGIWTTLEDHYNTVTAARKSLLVPNFSTPSASHHVLSSFHAIAER